MKDKKGIVILDVKNEQNEFAKTLALINAIEKEMEIDESIEKDIETTIRFGILPEDKEKSGIYGKKIKSQLVRNVERIIYEEKNDNKQVFKLVNIDSIVEKNTQAEIYYYLRISIEDAEDIVSLQYLFLMLQALGDMSDRVICFFVPFAEYYNKGDGDFSLYYKISHYLRLVSFDNFFGAFCSKEKNIVYAPLSKRKAGVQGTFLPLIEINKESYRVLSANIVDISDESGLLKDLYDIGNKIFEKKNKKLVSIKNEELQKMQRYTLLEYLLFVCLFKVDTSMESYKNIRMYLSMMRELSEGVFQIMENVVLHSAMRRGVFSLRIHDKDSQYIKKEHFNVGKDVLSYLEVGIADYNIQETMIENFLHKEGVPEEEIYRYGDSIAVNQFLGLFETELDKRVISAWENYRRKYPVNCMGLPKLANNLNGYNATIFMKSSTQYRIEDDRYYYRKIFNSEGEKSNNYSQLYFLPGTQYKLMFPITQSNTSNYNSDIFSNLLGNLVENDQSYAKFIFYNQQEIVIEDVEALSTKCEVIYASDDENAKDKVVQLWKNEINNIYASTRKELKKEEEREFVLYFDINKLPQLQENWKIETFCKGIVDSEICNKEKYLAFINSTTEFMQKFYDTFLLGMGTDNEIQIYLVESNVEKELFICGKDKDEVQRNMLQFAFIRGPIAKEKISLNDVDLLKYSRDICPFDVILSPYENSKESIFDRYISDVAEVELTEYQRAGYKISDTHMRLGSKVHVSAFYEIAILLQKPRVARKIAFQILRDLLNTHGIKILEEKLLFYGYASYSRMILESILGIASYIKTSMTKQDERQQEILLDEEQIDWGFAVYQNDIIVEKSLNRVGAIENIYFNSKEIRSNLDKYKVVQIVPISSTLTTFNKMWSNLKKELNASNRQEIINNYTVFWVRDVNGTESNPSKIESVYWEEVMKERQIKTSLIYPYPIYFCVKKSDWRDPLKCKWCYPDALLDEYVLVETDPTSTVPSLQLEVQESMPEKEENITNSERVIRLEKALKYGHIYRDNNHFQYYIDTSEYFVLEKNSIKTWIENLPKNNEAKQLCIIVTPQHHTNVEFCHYVNNYYYGGVADIISFDAKKEYKSNVQAKYADVKVMIEHAIEIGIEVSFIYVDDTIITGSAYRRVNNLIHTLLPEKYKKTVQIDKVFVLLNRLSYSSKKNYVENPTQNFHSYVDLNISSIRNYGTSCIMCELEREANLFRRRASTKYVSEYWNGKEYDYQAKSFEEFENEEFEKKNGYFRMLCSHYAANKFKVHEESSKTILKIIDLFLELKNEDNSSPIYRKVLSKDKLLAVKAYIKVLSRPFFSYGKNFKQCILDVLLVLAECFLNQELCNKLETKEIISNQKEYLNDCSIRAKFLELYSFIRELLGNNSKETLDFLASCLLESLTDLKSNYIIRAATLNNIHLFIKEMHNNPSDQIEYFFREIQTNIQRLINSSKDETKTLWFEYLLVEKKEYQNEITVLEFESQTVEQYNDFIENLYIENTRLHYDGTMRFVENVKDIKEVEATVSNLWNDYYIRNLIELVKLDYNLGEGELEETVKNHICNLTKFLYCIKQAREEGIDKYVQVRDRLEDLLQLKEKITIVINETDKKLKVPVLYSIFQGDKKRETEVIFNNIRNVIEDNALKKRGYYIGDNYVVIVLENNYDYLVNVKEIVDISEKRISPVYIYLSMDVGDRQRTLSCIRNVLMFRNQLLTLFMVDFNNNSMHVLAKQKTISKQLAHDKAGDHSSAQDLSSIEYALQNNQICNPNEPNVGNWLLLRAYTNMRIARLFRWYWTEGESIEKVYVKKGRSIDHWRAPMINIGQSLFDDSGKRNFERNDDFNASPSNYFKIIDAMVEYKYDIYGKSGTAKQFSDMESVLRQLNCIEANGLYYRSEFIICIILDICFSAINNSRYWDLELDNDEPEAEYINRYLYFQNNQNSRCTIEISTEKYNDDISYLVFKNVKVFKKQKSDEEYKDELERATKESASEKGLSLRTIKHYVENIWRGSEDMPKVEYQYVKEGEQWFFVSKLPILRRVENE